MREHLTPDRIANSILQKSRFKGTYLIVEGNSDYTLYRKFTDQEFCEIEIAFGNCNVIQVIEELQQRGFTDALGLIDSDFRRLDDDLPQNKNVIMSDDHDIEVMIIKSNALDTILTHHCDPTKYSTYLEDLKIKDIREDLLNLSKSIGILKWVNKSENLGLLFKPHKEDARPLDYAKFIDVKLFKFTGNENLINAVINYSMNKTKINTTNKAALQSLNSKKLDGVELNQLCNGHDICQILSLGLRKKLASLNSNVLSADQIELELILAYDSRYFEQTDIYKQIKSWEKQVGKQVLKF
ncbi:DUF4435 domain-containing protein [Flavobacterium sp. N3904]|uniref:DUF4435 domain-containing protein n=1 Tax=Flavobacterium sp. N3904 TaxID=2986835 RepID=UPI0022242A72|nr:DUF4435 domain-containing protein [Flavobacterium sp. N3904]